MSAFVACCVLVVVCCWLLLVVCRSLRVFVVCSLLIGVVCCLLFVGVFVGCCLRYGVRGLLFGACC